MSRAKRTFCWLDTKWLCQNSVMRSVSGDGVASISCIHQRAQLEALPDLLLHERAALLGGRVLRAGSAAARRRRRRRAAA